MQRLSRRFWRALGAVIAVGLVAFGGLPGAHGGFTGKVTDSASSYGSGDNVLTATTHSATCQTSTSTISSNSNTNCSSSLFPLALAGGSGSNSSTVANNGTISASSAKLTAGSACGVLAAPDGSSAGNNPAVAVGGVSSAGSSPFSGSTSLAFDGSTGYLQSVQDYNDPQTYSLAAWFETPSGSAGGGGIIGFGSQQPDSTQSDWDRLLWVNSAGHLVFAIYDGTTDEVTSPSTYNNGAWHYVVLTASSSGVDLYVDGSLVASNSAYTASEDYSGWWHIGWADDQYWSSQPNQEFFDGDLADVATFPTALGSTAVSTLYHAATQSAEQTDVLADAPTSYWPLTSLSTTTSGQIQSDNTTVSDSSVNANTGTAEGGMVPSMSSPFTGGRSWMFDGGSGYVETSVKETNPQAFAIAAWFQVPSGDGGTIMSFTNAQPNSGQAYWDRLLWVDNTGNLVFGTANGYDNELTTSGTYDDDSWYFVVAVASTTGMEIYVNGTKVASNTTTGAYSDNGWWHIGWGPESNWTDPPSPLYWQGKLTDVAILPGSVTGAQITSMYNQTTQSGEQTAVAAASPTYYWTMAPATYSTVTYCQEIDATVENDTVPASPTCLLPAGSGSCPALSSGDTLSTLAGESLTMPTIAAGSSDTVKISLEDQSTTYEGMYFSLPLTVSAASGGFTGSLEYPASTQAQMFTG